MDTSGARTPSVGIIDAARDISLAGRRDDGRLLGRGSECRRLDGLLEGLRRGRGGALVLSGEPGVGKTALVEHMIGQAPDAMVVSTRGLQSEASLSYAGLGDLLRPLAARLGELPKPQSAPLRSALALSYPGEPPTEYAVCVATMGLLTVAVSTSLFS